MLLQGINDNILFFKFVLLGYVPRQRKKVRALQRDEYIYWVGTKQKNWQNGGIRFSVDIGILFKYTHWGIKWALGGVS